MLHKTGCTDKDPWEIRIEAESDLGKLEKWAHKGMTFSSDWARLVHWETSKIPVRNVWLKAWLGVVVGHEQIQFSSGPGLSKSKAKNWDRL